MDGYIVSYAQNREDIILSAFFDHDEVGFYVDVGAYDPDDDSVTKFFYKKGWHGINIEPQANRIKLFNTYRKRDINICAGVSDKNTSLKLRSYNNQGRSSFSPEMIQTYRDTPDTQAYSYKDIEVPVVTLKHIFTERKVSSIQFLKVDVEGLEYEVLASNDWNIYRPEVICIEANHIVKDWRSMLIKRGYELVFFDGLNNYYADKNTNRAKKFNYVDTVIMNEPIVNYKLLPDFESRDKAVAWQESTIKSLKAELKETNSRVQALQSQVQALQNEIDEVTPLKRHIKRHIKYRMLESDQRIINKLSRVDSYNPQQVGEKVDAEDVTLAIDAARINDTANFLNYNRPIKHHPLLPVYSKSKQVTLKAGRKGLRRIKGPRS